MGAATEEEMVPEAASAFRQARNQSTRMQEAIVHCGEVVLL